jgi:hypothetical protein
MLNATDYYEKQNKSFKAPGQWVALKDTKAMMKDAGEKIAFYNKKGDTYYFSDILMEEYKKNFSKKKEEVKEVKKDKTSEKQWYDLVWEKYQKSFSDADRFYLEEKMLSILLGFNQERLNKQFGVKDFWSEATPVVKEVLCSFLAVFIIEIQGYGSNPGKYYYGNVINKYSDALSRHLVINRTKVIFKNDKHQVLLNNRLDFVKVDV